MSTKVETSVSGINPVTRFLDKLEMTDYVVCYTSIS